MPWKAKDIAEMLGVSTATVSLVLNNKPGVGEQRRQEIISKIKELDCEYMLKEHMVKNGTIGFVVYKREGSIVDESPFFTYILEGINHEVGKYGYNLSFIYINRGMSQTEREHQLSSSGCKGLILFAVEMHYDDLQLFKDSELPFVVLDNSFQQNDIDAVAINNVQGISKIITYLCDMGHSEIGYIRSKVRINSFEERFGAFRKQLVCAQKKFRKEYVLDVGYSEHEIRKDVMEYLNSSPNLPTAFFAENDFIGCNAMRTIQEAGYRVPQDVSIVGFDDRPICTVVEPGLTTVNVPKNIFGPAAVKLLLSKLEQKREQSLKIEVGTNLVIRESVMRRNA